MLLTLLALLKLPILPKVISDNSWCFNKSALPQIQRRKRDAGCALLSFSWIGKKTLWMILHQSGFRRTRHRMHICLRPESHNAGFESELNLQKTATNINFRYFEKKRFCQTSTKFCQTSFPPNLMPRDRGCAFLCLKQAFHWTGWKRDTLPKIISIILVFRPNYLSKTYVTLRWPCQRVPISSI